MFLDSIINSAYSSSKSREELIAINDKPDSEFKKLAEALILRRKEFL